MDYSLPTISGYRLTERLHAGESTAVYRAVTTGEHYLGGSETQIDRQACPVVIKLLGSPYSSSSELVRFRHQYTIAKNLSIAGIVKPLALVSWGHSYALVMEDVGGLSLKDYVQINGRLSVEQGMAIALQLTNILHHLSQHRVVHKDIKPSNILIHPDTHRVWIIDFSLASLFPKEPLGLHPTSWFEGTPFYLAPEQTGCIKRGIDYRADFYGLGVTLYELLTGQLPFQSDDPMEVIRWVIAKNPMPPCEVVGAGGQGSRGAGERGSRLALSGVEGGAGEQAQIIPKMLSEIVLKLMAKKAEDRYQCALEIKHDLQRCLDEWTETGAIADFELGAEERCDRCLNSEKLYGRETEGHINQLVAETFYTALNALASLQSVSEHTTERLQQVEADLAVLKQWASDAPMIYQHNVDLVAAEKYRVLGQKLEALERYDQAIAGANANECIQEEALANELAAKFYLDWGKEKIAAVYLQDAYDCYERWGAKAKTHDLAARYKDLLQPILKQPNAIDPLATLHSIAPMMTRLQTLTAHLPGVIYQVQTTHDGEMSVLYASSYCEDLFGVSAEAMMTGQFSFRDFVHQDDLPAIKRLVADNAQRLQPFDHTYRIVTHSGKLKWVHAISQPNQQANGLTLWDGVLMDVSDRKAAEQELLLKQNHLEALLNNIPHMAWIKDEESRFIAANKAVADVTGCSTIDIVGKTDYDIWPEELANAVRNDDVEVLQSEQSKVIEEQVPLTDGTFAWLETTKTPFRNADGDLAGTVGIAIDITARKAAEQSLHDSQAQFRRMTENVPGMIYRYVLRPDGHHGISYVSSQVREIYELDPEAVLQNASCMQERIHPDDRAKTDAICRESAETLQPFTVEHRLVLPEKGIRWIQATARPEQLDNGDIVWDGLALDITARKQLEQEQEKLIAVLESTPDFIGIANAQGEILWHNKPLRELRADLGYSGNHHSIAACHPDWVNDIILHEALPTAIQHGSWSGELALLDGEGNEIPVSQVIIAHKSDSDEVESFSTVMRDIRAIKRTEAALKLSEARSQATFTQAAVGFVESDLKTKKFIRVNDCFCNMLGYTSAELVEMTVKDITHPDDISASVEAIKQLHKGEIDSLNLEKRYIRKDGTVFWAETTAYLIKIQGGETVSRVGLIQDISEKKQFEVERQRADSALKLSEARANAAFEQAAVGIAESNLTDGKITRTNNRFCQMTGYTAQELELLTGADLTYPDDITDSRHKSKQLYAGQIDSFTVEKRYLRKDGSWFWASTAVTLIQNPEEDSPRCLAVVQDISDRKQAEEQLRHTLAQLETSNNELEAFAYSVSHDLRAPLRAINGFSQILLEDYGDLVDKEGQDYFARIRSNTNRMGQLIDDLLQLSRLSRSELRYTRVDLSRLAQEILHDLQSSEPDRQVNIIVKSEAPVFADVILMQVVMMNLLQNAWKFTRHHPTACIEFGSLPPDPSLSSGPIYFVRDDGAGFDMIYSHKIFDVCQRLHRADEFSGTGIGLASVKRAIHRHGGRVWAEAAVEQGATFFFTVPTLS